ncbi:ribonuclease H-like domain-containing protein [Rhizophagus clarus]|uniref:Ribonuclease H-like domain-containing protein n=2 Tax=Rhizophagus clarus TaxID=94130 RepID=A0A8H3LL85_9GLOM|nr:ribonuclease H-like domain-containing protein [Rhizophagus clarus]
MKRPRTHCLTKYIKILGKQNSCNNYAACIACVEKLENNELLKNTFTNKKPQVKNHLKNCVHFREKIGNQEELDKIIYLTDNEEEEETSQKRQRYQNNNNFGENNHEKVLKYLRSMQNSFKVSNFKLIEEEASVKSCSSISTLSTCSYHSKKNSIEGNLVRKMSKKETPKFERLLLRMSVVNGFPFQWVNHPATLEFFKFLSPFLVLPKRKALSNRILNRETKDLNTLRDEKLINHQIGVDASDISNERERLIEVIPKIKDLIQEINKLNIKLNAIVSDSAFAYAAARKAITVAAYFKNANNSYFISKLRDIQKELYNKCYSIVIPGETRWNSHYYCFKSLVRSKQALRNLAIRHERPQVGSSNTDELYLNSDFCQILLDNNWWEMIELLQDILLPYCSVLNKLQCDKARNQMIDRLKKRWDQWEQPLLLLSFMLHPKYRLEYFNSELNNLSYTSLGRYLTYYYKAWFKKRPKRLLLEFEDFCKVEPFNDETFEQFGDDVFFWSFVEGEYSELGAVALKIFGICVNAASVERMWSSMGFLHTNDKVLAMSQLRASINFSLREKELQQNKVQFLDPNVETEVEDPEIKDSEIPEDIENVEEDNTNIINLEHWERELNEWEEMLIEEEVARMEEEEALRENSNSNLEGDLLSEYTHPAIDERAKWDLRSLFNSSLNAPDYLNEMLNM